MAQWLPFSLVVAVLTVVLLALARQSQSMLQPPESPEDDERPDPVDHPGNELAHPDGVDTEPAPPGESQTPAEADSQIQATEGIPETLSGNGRRSPPDSATVYPERGDSRSSEQGPIELSPAALLANVAVTQGLVAVIVVAAAWYFAIPAAALGVTTNSLLGGLTTVAVGAAFGLVLWGGNELSTTVADVVGASYDEGVREQLAPDSPAGWGVLFFAVLPLIALSEELLFRAALIGVPAAGFDLSPWLLAVVSSLAFALGHGAQGRVGIVVTGVLGFVLAAGYIVSGSLLVVVVAHYVINALEFLVHELLGIEGVFASVTRLSVGSGPRE